MARCKVDVWGHHQMTVSFRTEPSTISYCTINALKLAQTQFGYFRHLYWAKCLQISVPILMLPSLPTACWCWCWCWCPPGLENGGIMTIAAHIPALQWTHHQPPAEPGISLQNALCCTQYTGSQFILFNTLLVFGSHQPILVFNFRVERAQLR